MDDVGRLQQLQDSLMLLKQRYPQLKLTKGHCRHPVHRDSTSTPGQAKADPFPLSVAVHINAPSSASRYDVDGLDLVLQLHRSILLTPLPEHALSIKLPDPQLPTALQSIIARTLHAVWLDASSEPACSAVCCNPSSTTTTTTVNRDVFGICAVLQHVEQNFVQLLTAYPQFIEAYEGVDSNGATQRRFALVSSEPPSLPAAPSNPTSGTLEAAATSSTVTQAAAAAAALTPASRPAVASAPAAPAITQTVAAAAPAGTASVTPEVCRAADCDTARQVNVTNQPRVQPQGPPRLSAADAPTLQGLLKVTVPMYPEDANAVLPRMQEAARHHQEEASAATQASRGPCQHQHQAAVAALQHQFQAAAVVQQQHQAAVAVPQQHQEAAALQQPVPALHGALANTSPASPPQSMPSMQPEPPPHCSATGQSAGETSRGAGGSRGRGRGRARPAVPGFRGLSRSAGVDGGQQTVGSWPRQALMDMHAVQRRYGRSCRLQPQHNLSQQNQLTQQAQQQPPPPQQQQSQQQRQVLADAQPAHSQGDPAEQQQQLLHAPCAVAPPVAALTAVVTHQDPQHEQHAQVSMALAPQHFSIMLRPTDPLWGAARGPLHVTGTLLPAVYPAAGSTNLTINPTRGVAAAETWVLQGAAERELQQQSGRSGQLLAVLRWLENFAGDELDRCFRAQQDMLESSTTQQDAQHQPCPTVSAGDATCPERGKAGFSRGKGVAAGLPSGGVRVIRATQQQQQQQQPQPRDGQRGHEDLQGLRLKPLVRDRDSAVGMRLPDHETTRTRQQQRQQQQERCNDLTTGESHAAAFHPCDTDSDSDTGSSRSDIHKKELYSRAGSSGGSNGGSDEGGEEHSAGDDQEHVDEVKLHGGEGAEGVGAGGYLVTLPGLKLDNVGVLEVALAAVQLSCTRCSSSVTVQLSPSGGTRTDSSAAATVVTAAQSATLQHTGSSAAAASSSKSNSGRPFAWEGTCSTCQQALSVLLRPRFVHVSSNILAGLKVSGCAPLDLLPGVYGVSCSECYAVGALRGLQVGMPASRTCSQCHRSLSVSVPAVAFLPQGAPAGSRQGGTPGVSRPYRAKLTGGDSRSLGVLQEGCPLPYNGACKHYRHSYRWLRFPCCGVRFPCDLCHEEATPDGHDAAWATRMVCGFCSREQPLASVCKHCGKKLAASAKQPSGRNTHHWEGGAGCRDVKVLDRRDAAKYRNSKAKTKSAKASRVGPKPWSGGGDGTRNRSERHT